MVKPVSVGFLIVVGACADGAPEASPDATTEWSVSVEPLTLVGGSDSRADYQLFRVVAASRLSDGRLVISNAGTSELRFYSPEGAFLRSSGGNGDGPGELRGIMQLVVLPGDTLMVLSFRPGITWFDPNGEFVRSQRIDFWGVGGLECRLGEGNWNLLEDGSLLSVFEDNFAPRGCPPTPPSPWRQTGLVARSDLWSGAFDTLVIMPATERNSPNYRVFGKSLLMTWDREAVYLSDTGTDEILKLNLSGDTLAVWTNPFPDRTVPPEAMTESIREFSRPDGSMERGNSYLYPESYPRAGRILVDTSGFLWVMAYPALLEPISSWTLTRPFAFRVDPAGAEWRVIGGDGSVVGSVRTPPGLYPLEIGEDYMVALARDELDVESVSVHRLARGH